MSSCEVSIVDTMWTAAKAMVLSLRALGLICVTAEAACTTVLRAIGDSCLVAK